MLAGCVNIRYYCRIWTDSIAVSVLGIGLLGPNSKSSRGVQLSLVGIYK